VTDYSIWPATNGPLADNADVAINLGTQFSVSSQAWVTAVRYFRGTVNVNPDDLRLWRVDSASTGTSLANVVPPAAVATGWQSVALLTPIELIPGQVYKVAAHMPTHYVATPNYWTVGGGGAGITNGVLIAQSSAASTGGQGTFRVGAAGLFPNSTFNGGNYWIDVVVTDVNPGGSTVVVNVTQAVENGSAHTIAPVHVVAVGQAREADSGDVITPGSAAETELRVRVRGYEPSHSARGAEPQRRVTGVEEGQ
jgi:hypothetical protein